MNKYLKLIGFLQMQFLRSHRQLKKDDPRIAPRRSRGGCQPKSGSAGASLAPETLRIGTAVEFDALEQSRVESNRLIGGPDTAHG